MDFYFIIILSSIFNSISCVELNHQIIPTIKVHDIFSGISSIIDLDNSENSEHTLASLENDLPYFTHPERYRALMHRTAGDKVKIRCAASGNPEPNITWTKDSHEINHSMRKVSYRKSTIILENLKSTDSGEYKCKLCNIHGCIEQTTRLYVIDPIPTHQPFNNKTAVVNETVEFNCSAVTDFGAHVHWTHFNPFNVNLSANIKWLETDQDKPGELVLKNVTHEHEGWYNCIASSDLGDSTATSYLNVVDGETSSNHPDLSVSELISILMISMSILLLAAIFIILVGFNKLKHEKRRTMEIVYQWKKKVIVEKQDEDEIDGLDSLHIPVIGIEKQRIASIQSYRINEKSMFNEYEFPLDSNWEFPRNHLKLGPTLGEGAFGRVVMAEAHGLIKPSQNQIVAVKMVKENHTDSDMMSLVREMEVMKMIGKHINIINLLGCCSQDGPLYVIVEYGLHGDLKNFLRKNFAMADHDSLNTRRLLTPKELTSFAVQIARGMEHLVSLRCVHRDLAARNVLVCDDHIVKIADFGLARDLQESDYYRIGLDGCLPVKWMAPETLEKRFYDCQSDVWSYGILLWEIMTFGEQPYPNILSLDHLFKYLKSDRRMDKPQQCPTDVYVLMRQCWKWNPEDRPTFTEIVFKLDYLLKSMLNISFLI